jgi:hypothetical protein
MAAAGDVQGLHTASIPPPGEIPPDESDGESVKVLICEPHAEVRALLGHVVTRLGFEPVYADAHSGGAPDDADVDVLLVEPADPAALSTARAFRLRRRELPIICASIYPDLPGAERLRPLAYLMKPFALIDLERALLAAVENAVAQA